MISADAYFIKHVATGGQVWIYERGRRVVHFADPRTLILTFDEAGRELHFSVQARCGRDNGTLRLHSDDARFAEPHEPRCSMCERLRFKPRGHRRI